MPLAVVLKEMTMSNSRPPSDFWEFSPPDDDLEFDPSSASNSIVPKSIIAVTGTTQGPVNLKSENRPERKGSIIPASAFRKPEVDSIINHKLTPENPLSYTRTPVVSIAGPPFSLDSSQQSLHSLQGFSQPVFYTPPALSPSARQLMEAIIDDVALIKKFQKLYDERALNSYLESLCRQMSQSPMSPLGLMPEQHVDIQNWRVPRSLHELIVITGRETGFDYFTCLISIICIISICLCGHFTIQVKNGVEESVNLYCLLIGHSGMRKSAFIKRFKKIIVKFIEERQRLFDMESPQQERLVRFLKKTSKEEEKGIFAKIVKECRLSNGQLDYRKAKDLLESNAEWLDRAAGEMCEIGSRPQYLLDVGTRIGLIKALGSQGECGAVLAEEPGWLLKIMDSATLNEDAMIYSYDAERISHNSSRERIILDNPCLNILSAIQLGLAGDFFHPHTKKGKHLKKQGFMDRFMPVFIRRIVEWECYPSCPCLITEARFPESDFSIEQLESALNEMLEAFFPAEHKRKVESLTLSAEAHANWESFADKNERLAQQEHNKPLEAFLRKLHGMACRIAGIIHIWSNFPEWPVEVSAETMALAINIAETLIPHAEYAFKPSGLSALKDAEKVEDWIKLHRRYVFTYRQALQGVYDLDKKRLMPALDALQRANRIAQHPDLDKIRICVVNPQLLI
ncbi:hypothetical protein C4J81_16060 [Deltaproteobacteria bacterium Smac51]|nr:hypothetical protein C4J81_16060 [Deltaproteobacteria bacterium Smac51]